MASQPPSREHVCVHSILMYGACACLRYSPNSWVPPTTLKSGGIRFATGRYPRKPQAGKKPVSLATRRRLERLGRDYQPPVDSNEMKRLNAEKKKMRQLQKQRKLRQLQKANALRQAVAQAAATDGFSPSPFHHEAYLPPFAKQDLVEDPSTDRDAGWDHTRHQAAKLQAELAQLNDEIRVDDQKSASEAGQTSAQKERVDNDSHINSNNGDGDSDTQHTTGRSVRAECPRHDVDDAQDRQKFQDCAAPPPAAVAHDGGTNAGKRHVDTATLEQGTGTAKDETVGLNVNRIPALACENANMATDLVADAALDTAVAADAAADIATDEVKSKYDDVETGHQSGVHQATADQQEAPGRSYHGENGNIQQPGPGLSHGTGGNVTIAEVMTGAEKEEQQATKLQAAGRGFLMRKRARKLMEQRAEELRRIQREYITQAVSYVRSHLAEVLHEDVVREQVDAWGQLVWGRLRDMVATVTVSRASTKTKLRVQGEVPAQFAVAFGDLMDLNVIQDSYLKLSSIGDKSPLIGSSVSPGDVVLSVRSGVGTWQHTYCTNCNVQCSTTVVRVIVRTCSHGNAICGCSRSTGNTSTMLPASLS